MIVVAIAGVALVGALVFMLLRSRRGAASDVAGAPSGTTKTRFKTGGADRLVKEGRAGEAASKAIKEKNFEEAIDLYRIANLPAQAADAARRGGKLKQAAELFEMAGEKRKAANLWEQAGVFDRAAQLREKPDASAASDRPPHDSAAPAADADPALAAEVQFRRVEARLKKGKKVGEAVEAVDKGELQEAGREAADKLLGAGEMRRAAEVLRDAELFDEAIHLFVNVLGSPGEAAPLLARRGNHQRAAELYEMAGELERAAGSWVEVAKKAEAPDSYVDKIEQLSPEVAFEFLMAITRERPMAQENAELHYRLGRAFEQRGEPDQARALFEAIQAQIGRYKDVAERVRALPFRRESASRGPDALSMPPAMVAAASDPLRRGTGPPAKPSDETLDLGLEPKPGPLDLDILGPGPGHSSPPVAQLPSAPQRASERPAPPEDSSYAFVAPSSRKRGRRQAASGPVSDAAAQQIRDIVMEASRAAAQHVRHVEIIERIQPSVIVVDHRERRQRWWAGESPAMLSSGLEQQPIQIEILSDAAVRASQIGPSLESLLELIQGKECDLGNIEVFYRLGLAYLAKGDWSLALDAFDKVDEASPGYRDADKRAETIRAWQAAMGKRLTELGTPEGKPASRADPSTVGRYRLDGELGRGGMAVVYRANDVVLGRNVALKFMSEEVSDRKDLRDMFEREAKAAASLNHPGIVTVYDFGMLEGRYFISMELVDGAPVDELQDQLTIVESLQIARQALEALHYAHERGIVHRDIKPSNLMRTSTGIVKIMDFGLAKPLVSGEKKRSIVAGTPAFMPPEQLAGEEVDRRADIFAMGVTLYELLTRELPYEGLDRTKTPTAPQELVPAIPELVDWTIMRAMEPDRERRWSSAADFAGALKRVLGAVGRFSSKPPSGADPGVQ